MLSAMTMTIKIRPNHPDEWSLTWPNKTDHLAPCGGCAD
jgi:hypothetical protein